MSQPTSSKTTPGSTKRREIYKYEAPWMLYGLAWATRPDRHFRLAIGSFMEEYNNKIQVVTLDENSGEFSSLGTFEHPYPTTKILWMPDSVRTF